MGPKPGLSKNNLNEVAQIRKKYMLRCKRKKCHNDCYAFKTKECLALHDKLHYSQQGRKKGKELKEKIQSCI